VIKDLGPGDPASVGPYRLIGRLGAGGMGQVYLARSPGGRLVAIKLIRPELAEERGFRSRFSSEISAAKNVSGIYTAAVVDADAEAELPWMATVYVPGPSLTDAVEDNGPLPVKSVFALAAGLAEALQAIHRADLVHRDLKPSNVLLAEDGPRVIDFGISLALERSMMTATGMVMGSPGFMSPEQARGQREVGAPTDVFSLGAVLAFAATGNNPFGGGPTPALLYRVVNETPDLAAVPAPLTALIGDCLAKDPAGRPTTAELLERLSDDVGVLTGGQWLPPPITETMKRYSPTLLAALPASAGQIPVGQTPARLAALASGVRPAATPPAPATPPVPATRAEHGGFADTSLVAMPGAVAGGRTIPGGPHGTPPTAPPTRPPAGPPSPLRRWRLALIAAAVAIVVAVAAILLTSRSPAATSKTGPTQTATQAGNRTGAPTPTATTAGPSPTVTPSSQPAASTPVTRPTATQSASSSPPPTTTTSPSSQPTTTAPSSSTQPASSPASSQASTQSAAAPTPTGAQAPAAG
jgi:serine/threonine protein kinase